MRGLPDPWYHCEIWKDKNDCLTSPRSSDNLWFVNSLNTLYVHAYKIWEYPPISMGSCHQILKWWQRDHFERIPFRTKEQFKNQSIGRKLWTYIINIRTNSFSSISPRRYTTSSAVIVYFIEKGLRARQWFVIFYVCSSKGCDPSSKCRFYRGVLPERYG